MLKSIKTAAALGLVLLLMLCVCASASIVDQKTSTLTGNGNVKQLTCNAVVTLDAGVYTYSYTLTYDIGPDAVHIYKIQNPNCCAYFNAANMPNDASKFTNPADGNSNWVGWLNGQFVVGTTRTFSYQSLYAPIVRDLEVYHYAVDGGSAAIGKTLGMRDAIPEPSSLIALMFGVVGTVSVVARRRR
jgi:hypothetical protein